VEKHWRKGGGEEKTDLVRIRPRVRTQPREQRDVLVRHLGLQFLDRRPRLRVAVRSIFPHPRDSCERTLPVERGEGQGKSVGQGKERRFGG